MRFILPNPTMLDPNFTLPIGSKRVILSNDSHFNFIIMTPLKTVNRKNRASIGLYPAYFSAHSHLQICGPLSKGSIHNSGFG